MANQEHLAILKQGVERWNQWRKEHPRIRINLKGIDLSKSNLQKVNFSHINLSGANLRNADLSNADLFGADLRRATLIEANLNSAYLRTANLKEADLTYATLRGVDLSSAILSGAALDEADLGGANLNNAALNGASLNYAAMREATLTGAILIGATLIGTTLTGANLRGANLCRTGLNRTSLRGADLSGADLSSAVLVKTDCTDAILTDCQIYGISVWDVRLERAAQFSLVITPPDEPPITVDNLKVAQFIYLLLNNREIREVIDTITSKMVLILGRFTDERKAVLDALRDELRKHDYLPVLFDFERPANRDFTETIRTLAHLSQFILADITEPSSIPQELLAIVPDLEVPVQPLLEEGKKQYAMFPDLRKHPWVFPVHLYIDQASLIASLPTEIIEPSKKKARELAVEKAKRLERT